MTTQPPTESDAAAASSSGEPSPGSPDVELRVADPGSAIESIEQLRRFHYTGTLEAAMSEDFGSALLHQFRDPERIRFGYPLVLEPGGGESGSGCVPIDEYLNDRVSEQQRLLYDNIPRLERRLRDGLNGSIATLASRLRQAGQDVRRELGLSSASDTELGVQLEALVDAIPDGTQLLGYGDGALGHLLWRAVGEVVMGAQSDMRRRAAQLASKLDDMVRATPLGDTSAGRVRSTMGGASGLVNSDALAGLLGSKRPASQSTPEHAERLTGLCDTLISFSSGDRQPSLIVVSEDEVPWPLDDPGIRWVKTDTPAIEAKRVFDEAAAAMVEAYRAMRSAVLESRFEWDEEEHGPWLEGIDWHNFTNEELRALPAVVVVTGSEFAAHDELPALSELLHSRRPIHVVTIARPEGNPGEAHESHELERARTELGFTGLAARQALVHQGTLSRPEHCLEGFERALRGCVPSLHVFSSDAAVRNGGASTHASGWLYVRAAEAARAHPSYIYDPEAGASWAEQFEIGPLDDTELDWPLYPLLYLDAEGSEREQRFAFTFADFALLSRAYSGHFAPAAMSVADGALIPLDEYLAESLRGEPEKLPFVWGADSQGQMVRLVVSRAITYATQDRLSSWRMVQELSGTRSPYVEAAVRQERDAADRAREDLKAELEAKHRTELEAVRNDTAREAMERLAASLVQADLGALEARVAASVSAPTTSAPAEKAPPSEPGEVAPVTEPTAESAEDDEDDVLEPYIDSALCTSCNDCINLNPQIFHYNANKQAEILNPRGGPFSDLVLAAEKCPSLCIHPGSPWDPNEPHLEALVARAKPFN